MSTFCVQNEAIIIKMTHRHHNILCFLLLILMPGILVAEDNRLALVIGNGQYEDSPLSNPINDASDMASVLENLGFKVILRTDANRREMGRAIREFGRELKQNRGVGLFYYAGHGMQIDGANYLIPTDTPMEEEDEVPYESIDVRSVLAKMESAGNALNLVILDACRNNPFPSRFRSTSRGLARVQAPIGSLVVYSTAPGSVAADGEGRNGVFTGALLEQLQTEGLSLTETIRRTRAAVVRLTDGQQVPWESSSLLTDYYFSPKSEPQPQLATRAAISEPAEPQPTVPPVQTPAEPVAQESRAERLLKNEPLALLDNTATVAPGKRPIKPEEPDNEGDTGAIIEQPASQSSRQETQPTATATLTVNVNPPDARIRIMNIVEKYTSGITLDKARQYDLYITRRGYLPYRQNVMLDEDVTTMDIVLKKKSVTEPQMVAIAGGRYTMGCLTEDQLCEPFEKPRHNVIIQPFSMAMTEVTVGQFDEFVASTGYATDAEKNAGGNSGCFVWSDGGGISRSAARWQWDESKNWRNPGYAQTSEHPVSCVSWNDADRYAKWLAQRTGRPYALPSEAEWELAARAGSQSVFGDATTAQGLCASANVADRTESPSGSKWSNRISCHDNYWYSAPVASYQANGFGLFDMQGNVWEWVEDIWSNDFSNTPRDGSANTRGSSDAHVLRGGGWDSEAKRARLSSRSRGGSTGRASMTGFRLVLRQAD